MGDISGNQFLNDTKYSINVGSVPKILQSEQLNIYRMSLNVISKYMFLIDWFFKSDLIVTAISMTIPRQRVDDTSKVSQLFWKHKNSLLLWLY